MSDFDLHFSYSSTNEASSFKLLELPAELNKLIESAIENSETLRLTVKGHTTDDAVLCTSDKTYAMRSVVLSNSVLVVTAPPDGASALDFTDDAVVVRDQVNEVIELVPVVPKLHKLGNLLRGREYDEGQEDMEEEVEDPSVKKLTYLEAREQIQASDVELDIGLKQKRILIIQGELRPIALSYLGNILELILNLLVSLSLPHSAASVEELSSALADQHEISRVVSTQVMSWFGHIEEGVWKMDDIAVVREVGLSVLIHHKHNAIHKDELIAKWKSLVGDTFESSISLELLAGEYIAAITQTPDENMLKYFPSSGLPMEPAARFSDLFLTRSRWKVEDITPFLSEIAVNSKERDKLLLKYCRATSDANGVWYTARAQYNG